MYVYYFSLAFLVFITVRIAIVRIIDVIKVSQGPLTLLRKVLREQFYVYLPFVMIQLLFVGLKLCIH